MEILEYFTSKQKERWISEMEKSDWGAGQYLAKLLREGQLKQLVGENTLVLMLTDGEKLVSFCTYAPLDDVQPTDMTPWIGFVYTFPEYRGHAYAGKLLDYAECIAAIMGKEAVYISTNHIGLYEKYGYTFYKMDHDVWGEETRVYRKLLLENESEKEDRMNRGNEYKAKIVAAAKEGVNPVAVCGLSCRHCFLGQWCGGCKSTFNCCSFGTLFEKGKCPNIACAEERKIEGCYSCEELETCTKGFYTPENDGAAASKAQALYRKKYGEEKFLKMKDLLHQNYVFEKTQEILGQDVEKALELLEKILP